MFLRMLAIKSGQITFANNLNARISNTNYNQWKVFTRNNKKKEATV